MCVQHGWFKLSKYSNDSKDRGELRVHIEFEPSGQSFIGVPDALNVSQRDDQSSQEEPCPPAPTVAELELARGASTGIALGWYQLLETVWPRTFKGYRGNALIEGWVYMRELHRKTRTGSIFDKVEVSAVAEQSRAAPSPSAAFPLLATAIWPLTPFMSMQRLGRSSRDQV